MDTPETGRPPRSLLSRARASRWQQTLQRLRSRPSLSVGDVMTLQMEGTYSAEHEWAALLAPSCAHTLMVPAASAIHRKDWDA